MKREVAEKGFEIYELNGKAAGEGLTARLS